MPESALELIISYLEITALVNLIRSANRALRYKLLVSGGISSLSIMYPIYQRSYSSCSLTLMLPLQSRCFPWTAQYTLQSKKYKSAPPLNFFGSGGLRSLSICLGSFSSTSYMPFTMTLQDLPPTLTHLEVDMSCSWYFVAPSASSSSITGRWQKIGGTSDSSKYEQLDFAELCPNLRQLTYLRSGLDVTSTVYLVSHLPQGLESLITFTDTEYSIFDVVSFPPALRTLGLLLDPARSHGRCKWLSTEDARRIPSSVTHLQLPDYVLAGLNSTTPYPLNLPELSTLFVHDITCTILMSLPPSLTKFCTTSDDSRPYRIPTEEYILPSQPLQPVYAMDLFGMSVKYSVCAPHTSIGPGIYAPAQLPPNIVNFQYFEPINAGCASIVCFPWIRTLHIRMAGSGEWHERLTQLRSAACANLETLRIETTDPFPESLLLPPRKQDPPKNKTSNPQPAWRSFLPPNLTRLEISEVALQGLSLPVSATLYDDDLLKHSFHQALSEQYPNTCIVLLEPKPYMTKFVLEHIPRNLHTLALHKATFDVRSLPKTLTKLCIPLKLLAQETSFKFKYEGVPTPPLWRLPPLLTEIQFDELLTEDWHNDPSNTHDHVDNRKFVLVEDLLRQCKGLKKIIGGFLLPSPSCLPDALFEKDAPLSDSPYMSIVLPHQLSAWYRDEYAKKGLTLEQTRFVFNPTVFNDMPRIRTRKAKVSAEFLFSSGNSLKFWPGLRRLDLKNCVLSPLPHGARRLVTAPFPHTLRKLIVSGFIGYNLLWESQVPLPTSLASLIVHDPSCEDVEKGRFPAKFAAPFATHQHDCHVEIHFVESDTSIGAFFLGPLTLFCYDDPPVRLGKDAQKEAKQLGLRNVTSLALSQHFISWTITIPK